MSLNPTEYCDCTRRFVCRQRGWVQRPGTIHANRGLSASAAGDPASAGAKGMTPAAAQAAANAAAQPRDVREGFSLVWQKVDAWIEAGISLIPNLVVGLVVA